jgi:hypothetical protein
MKFVVCGAGNPADPSSKAGPDMGSRLVFGRRAKWLFYFGSGVAPGTFVREKHKYISNIDFSLFLLYIKNL